MLASFLCWGNFSKPTYIYTMNGDFRAFGELFFEHSFHVNIFEAEK